MNCILVLCLLSPPYIYMYIHIRPAANNIILLVPRPEIKSGNDPAVAEVKKQ